MIPKSTINSIFEAIQIEDVIGDFIQLKKSGANLKGLSPFTNERTPSFTVSPAKQIWKDFSSGKGGNAVSFLMEYEHYTYPEALRYLAKKYNIEIVEKEDSSEEKLLRNHRESLYLLNQYATDYFSDALWKSEKGRAIALTYFKERNLSENTIKFFELGYSPDIWDAFTKKALKDTYQLKLLGDSGLTIVKEDKHFDRFKGRVIFPIHSISGRILGFGGRSLSNNKTVAKYINSPENDLYHKGHILYGYYQAKQEISKENNCYLVEGYMDVLQFHQIGIKNVVASSGTALTKEQIHLIKRFTPNITLLYDSDVAGQKASLRGIDLILEQSMNVKICTFPKGEDPDSFARTNSFEEVVSYLNDFSTDFISYKAQLLFEESKNDPINKSEVTRDIIVSISKINDPIKREVYVQECSKIMNVSQNVLFSALSQISKDKSLQKKTQRQNWSESLTLHATKVEEKIDVQAFLEREIIKILTLYGYCESEFTDYILVEEDNEIVEKQRVTSKKVFEKIYLELQQDEITFANPLFKKVYDDLIDAHSQNSDFKLATFLEKAPQETVELISSIVMEEEKYRLSNWEGKGINLIPKNKTIEKLVQDTITDFRKLLITKIIDDLGEKVDKSDRQLEILDDIHSYNQLKVNLTKKTVRRLVNS